MPVSKLKNLALLILLLANLLLLALLIPKKLEQHKQAEDLRVSLSQFCNKQNVSLDPDIVPETTPLYEMELTGGTAGKQAALQALLGEHTLSEDSSISASALTGGRWKDGSIKLKLTGRDAISDLERDGKKILQTLQFPYSELSAPHRHSPGVYSLHADQIVLGVPVFSDGLTLTYINSILTEISGSYYTGTLTKTNETACISAADAVVSFLSCRVDLGWVGSSITAVKQGYLPTVASSTSVRLTPTWELTTDTGSFYVNGLTSEVIPVQNS